MSDYVKEGIAELRKHIKELAGMTDEAAEVLYATWSDIGHCASWLVVEEWSIRRFEEWLHSCQGSKPSQKFFAELAAEARKPHFGAGEFTRALLLRAQEAGLYSPDKEQS